LLPVHSYTVSVAAVLVRVAAGTRAVVGGYIVCVTRRAAYSRHRQVCVTRHTPGLRTTESLKVPRAPGDTGQPAKRRLESIPETEE